MSNTIQGYIVEIKDTQQVTDKFKKRTFWVEHGSNPEYPEVSEFQLTQDRCEILDSYQERDLIDVHFDVKGRKWTSPEGDEKCFNTLQACKIEKVAKNAPQGDSKAESSDEDDLPWGE